jgi:hypothetical protein
MVFKFPCFCPLPRETNEGLLGFLSIIYGAHTLAVAVRIKAKYLVTRQTAHKKCIYAHPVQCADVAGEQCCTFLR